MLLLTIFLGASVTASGESLNAVLTRDLVAVSDGQYVHTQINRCRVAASGGSGGLAQVVSVSREIVASESLLSRDQFVAISTQLMVRNRIALASILWPGIDPLDALAAIECRRAADLVTASDFSIAVRMTPAGVTMETTNIKTGNNATDQFEWDEIINLGTD